VTTMAAIVLGVVFTASGALKLRDPMWPDAALSLGAPLWAVPAVAPFELILGATLVSGLAQRQLAILALVTLVVFTLLLVRQLRSGDEAPPCACFGSLSAKPIGIHSIVRNGVLMLLSICAVV